MLKANIDLYILSIHKYTTSTCVDVVITPLFQVQEFKPWSDLYSRSSNK